MVDFAQSGRLVAIKSVTRPNRRITGDADLRCGWRLCPNESHLRRLLRESVVGLHVKQAIHMDTSFQVTSQIKLLGDARSTQMLQIDADF